ncbi:hypothetical protein [Pseudarthrobacter cellobiosi]|uniref:hypothetical protein n=1 Tax=Pseudarthrobacter cellobiosi TaxID=2953654 RepID=UPI00208F4882|nr:MULTISPECIES: hypothetical protein [unclassified Pseudarthrobacter]MCO4255086.1 hypothetical protein [Pseudarthrobacter sp. HLT1-5]MCO4275207.1 hypothetical protein [Pseudarthrobacter sp. HLT3-5]
MILLGVFFDALEQNADASGLGGMFTTLAVLFGILAITVQFPPETFGKPLEEGADAAEEEVAIYGH